jgi:hypothetical protein
MPAANFDMRNQKENFMNSATAPSGTRPPVETKKVSGRRQLRFSSLDEILADARQLAAQPVRQLGNWSLGQTFSHLARAMDLAVDEAKFKVPLMVRIIVPLFKKRILNGTMPPGFKLKKDAAKHLVPLEPVSTDAGLRELEAAVERQRSEPNRAKSPILGRLTEAEWNQLHCRHAELHLSFFVPENVASGT